MSANDYPHDPFGDRERWADNSRDGTKRLTKADVGFAYDFSYTTLEEEAYDGGWNRIQRPVGGDPKPTCTSGMRGEEGYDADSAGRDGDTTDRY